jgi:transposase
MPELPDNILHLPQYQVLGCKSTDDEMHFQVDVPDPIACEECGVQGEFVRFGKRDVPYRDLPIQGKRVTLWLVRRRHTCRACKTTLSLRESRYGSLNLSPFTRHSRTTASRLW